MTARIAAARIAAAHDGAAELVVTLEFANGGTSEVSLDGFAGAALMATCNADGIDDLLGQDWGTVRDALQQAYNRYSDNTQLP